METPPSEDKGASRHGQSVFGWAAWVGASVASAAFPALENAQSHKPRVFIYVFKSNGILSTCEKLEDLHVLETPLGHAMLSEMAWTGLGAPLSKVLPESPDHRWVRTCAKPVLGTGLPGSPRGAPAPRRPRPCHLAVPGTFGFTCASGRLRWSTWAL